MYIHLFNTIIVTYLLVFLSSFKKGLSSLGVLSAIQQHPSAMEEVFLAGVKEPLSAAQFDALCDVEFAEQGSNKRQIENLALVFWRDMLQDLEGLLFDNIFVNPVVLGSNVIGYM